MVLVLDRQTGRQTDRQTDSQTDRIVLVLNRRTGRQGERQKYMDNVIDFGNKKLSCCIGGQVNHLVDCELKVDKDETKTIANLEKLT